MTRGAFRTALVTVVCLGAGAMLLAADVRITPVQDAGKVLASVSAPSAYSSDVRDAVQSGVAVTLQFVVELKRPSALWFDSTLATVKVSSVVKFDNLARVYQVSKVNDGRVFFSQTHDKEDQARAWATEFERVQLSDGASLEANADYYVRVRVRASPHKSSFISTFLIWPFGRDDADGRADFTYLR